MNQPVTLDRASLHAPFTVVSVDVPPMTTARLTAHGLRRGATVKLVQELAGGSRVVAVGGGRIALGRDVLAGLRAEAVA